MHSLMDFCLIQSAGGRKEDENIFKQFSEQVEVDFYYVRFK